MSHDRPISIHALREEGDLFSQVCKDGIVISIHALREEGDGTSWSWRTLPCISIHALREEGDIQARLFAAHDDISIHALREEGDYNPFVHTCFFGYFYPRPPRGGRLVEFCQLHQPVVFLSTPSARRATRNSYMFTRFLRDFYPRPPRGGRPHDVVFVGECNFISIHALREEGDSS